MAVDDPFVPADPTQRPRPGAGRRGTHESTISPRPSVTRPYEGDPLPPSARAFLGLGLNPLVQAASPILLLIGGLRSSTSSTDVSGLRRHALDEIRRFEENAQRAGVRNEIVLAARYALCAGLDESVLSTPWGAQSEWAQHPLLVALHREAWGGEKFFEMLDRISVDPARHIDLMELQYLILALGFTGKYQMLERGHEQLADLQQALYRKIRAERGHPPSELALQWRGLEDQRNRLIRYVPWWVVAVAALTILAVTFGMFYTWLAQLADPIHAKLAQVGIGEPQIPPSPPPPGPTLKQLLKPDEDAGALTVTESGRRSVVTMRGSDLFPSGSADVNPAYEATLQHVAAALNKVRGAVTIVGHTDNQPIKSLRYASNYDLSRERALNVSNVLKRTLDSSMNPAVTGRGPSQPVAEGSDPDSRARNRRVEIIHVR
ncbi:MAG TPA: type IVB secretion system protein IcmH/DotU [Vicinamibacterales bacterium]|nr:type IVB secretion system protein IcmH/DotU [Vicinamibacterales bacterium]